MRTLFSILSEIDAVDVPLVFKIQKQWYSIVGEDVARHSVPINIKDEVFIIAVDHPVWKTELELLKRFLIERINADYSLSCKDIKIQVSKKLIKNNYSDKKKTKKEDSVFIFEEDDIDKLRKSVDLIEDIVAKERFIKIIDIIERNKTK